jgi:hypothetical protein
LPDQPGDRRDPTPDEASVGLCWTCRHSTVVVTDRGSRFYICERSRRDERFPRYPRLPVVACVGWEERGE